MYQGYSEKGPQHLNKKPQNCQMGLCKIKSLYSKKAISRLKKHAYRMRGKCLSTSIRGLISRVHKELCTTNPQIIQSLIGSQTEQNVFRMKFF